jgi:septal ring factor EnvC (AmiA/AmiB activator)
MRCGRSGTITWSPESEGSQTRSRVSWLAVALVLVCASASAQKPRAAHDGGAGAAGGPVSAQRKQKLQGEQRELRARLTQLKKRLAEAEAAHSEASDALAASETAISAANRRLRELAHTRRQVEEQIGALQERERGAHSRQGAHELAVGQMIRTRVSLDARRPWQELLDGTSPGGAARTRMYVDRVIHAELRQIGDLRQRREELAGLEAQLRDRQAELASIATEERASRAQLLSQQAARKATLARLSREIAAQRSSVAGLEHDEARLGSLIDQISRLLAEQARRTAPGHAPPVAPGSHGEAPSRAEALAKAPSLAAFSALRGKLELPVDGQLGARFGSARRDEDGQPEAGAPTWKGLFIRAPAGAEVHAVAAGRVVFADWLRGFGNLMILDHGNGLLSVYGNNETLLRGIGDVVQAREVVAAVGSTGGSRESGLYFELRYQGKPFDPLAWVGPR